MTAEKKLIPVPFVGSKRAASDLARRNRLHYKLACEFIKEFPLGTILTTQKFDEWVERLWERTDPLVYRLDDVLSRLEGVTVESVTPEIINKELGLYRAPPEDTPRSSDQYLAYIQRRNQLRYRISDAGCHPRMLDRDLPTFVIKIGGTGLRVESPEDAAVDRDVIRGFISLVRHKKKVWQRLIQGIDMAKVSPYFRMLLLGFQDSFTEAEDHINVTTKALARRLHAIVKAAELERQEGRLPPRALNELNGESTQGDLFDDEEDDDFI